MLGMPPLAPAARRSTGYPMKTEMRRSCLSLFYFLLLAFKPCPCLTLSCVHTATSCIAHASRGLLCTVTCTAYRSTTLFFPSDISSEIACLSSFPAGDKLSPLQKPLTQYQNAACRIEKVLCIQPHRFLRDHPVHPNPIQYIPSRSSSLHRQKG